MKVCDLLETMNNNSIVAIRLPGHSYIMKGIAKDIYNIAGIEILNKKILRTRIHDNFLAITIEL